MEQAPRLVAGDALAHCDQVLLGHQLGDRLLPVLGEAHVAVGDDTGQLLALALDDRDAGDAVPVHQGQRIQQRLVGIDGNRIDHHAAFDLLDLADLVGLLADREVLVHHTDAAGLGHGDGQARLGDGVHRRGKQGDAQLDGARQSGGGIGVVRQDRGFARLQQNIVEGERQRQFHANPLIIRPQRRISVVG
jgi:hypothetical protein